MQWSVNTLRVRRYLAWFGQSWHIYGCKLESSVTALEEVFSFFKSIPICILRSKPNQTIWCKFSNQVYSIYKRNIELLSLLNPSVFLSLWPIPRDIRNPVVRSPWSYLIEEGRGQWVTRRRRLSLLTNSALVYRVQMRGGGIAGSWPMSAAVHITWHGFRINFGDLPPYLTHGRGQCEC